VRSTTEGCTGPAQAGPVLSGVTVYPDGIRAVDTHYVRPRLDASHLIVEDGRAAFVDTGATPAVPHLFAALREADVAPEQVDWIWLTHIHLDHAGGAGALLEHLPNARVVVHPRGASHLIDPTRLIAATRAVYGDAVYDRLYGEIRAIPAERLTVAGDGDAYALAGRVFRVLHTPGHALHHQVYVDERTHGVFTGDTFGISYREFDVDGRAFILPTTTPTQFDPEQLLASIERVLALAPVALYLTHYGRVTDVPRVGADLREAVRAYVTIARRHADAADPAHAMQADLTAWTFAALDRHGDRTPDGRRRALLDPDTRLNADGLAAWLRRRA
jgi:glyoxylase-like metal-dependent hydrolase (beta-lactamase superfamily II)